MTEAELWDQLVQWVLGGGAAMMSFITIMFAFLVMAYFVGAKLSRIQAATVSALFIWASCIMIYAVVGYFYRAQMFKDRLIVINPDLQFFSFPSRIDNSCIDDGHRDDRVFDILVSG